MTIKARSRTKSLAELLSQAEKKGEVKVKNKNGQIFVIRPIRKSPSPLKVKGVKLNISSAEILEFIKEGRRFSA
jgi:hypothetical protein